MIKMEIKSKKYINEGFNSKAYIINDEYILLEGVNKNSYDNYKKYSESLNKLVDVKSLQIPNIIELIAPNNEFPNGAMVYKMIKGHTFTKSYIDKVDKEQLAKKLADFMNELYEIIYVFLTIFLYLPKCPQSLILSALRAFCFCGKPHISRSIFLYFPCQSWLKSW